MRPDEIWSIAYETEKGGIFIHKNHVKEMQILIIYHIVHHDSIYAYRRFLPTLPTSALDFLWSSKKSLEINVYQIFLRLHNTLLEAEMENAWRFAYL